MKMMSRLGEIVRLIAEDDLWNKSDYKTVIWHYKGTECARKFDEWLEKRIKLEIERHDILKNTH